LLPHLAPPNTAIAALVGIDGHRTCKSALLSLLGVGWKWFNTCRAFVEEGVMPTHGLCGKESNRKRKFVEEEEADLEAFMENLKQFAEPSATRFVREATGQIETHDTDDDALCLGSSWTKRDCYKRCCLERGYDAETSSIGVTKLIAISLDPDEEKKSCLGWTTFYDYWKKAYPKLRVSKPAEDICGQCHIFCNQHKCRSQTIANENNDSDDDDDDDDNDDGEDRNGNGGNEELRFEELRFEELRFSSDEEDEPSRREENKEMTDDEIVNVTSVMDAENEDAAPGLIADYEQNIIDAAGHVKSAKSQRLLFNEMIANSREEVKNKVPHKHFRRCCVVVHCQLMTLPHFGGIQPGETHCCSPSNCNTLGCVDPSEEGGDRLCAHPCHEGQGKKGGDNVASLIIKQLKHLGLLDRSEGMGKELNIVFDNCPGQNKNNFVLRLVPCLAEMGYFEEVNFIFLVVGHTKNCCDRMFNLLKIQCRKSNTCSTEDLVKVLGTNKKATVLEVAPEDFKDFNHIFNCERDMLNDSKLVVKLRKSNLEDAESIEFEIIKTRFFGRDRHPVGRIGLQQATAARPSVMNTEKDPDDPEKDCCGIVILHPQGIPDYEQVELHTNCRKHVPEKHKDVTCPKPAESVLATIKNERAQRAKGEKIKKDEKEKMIKKDSVKTK
jgi:hypothetical protein